MRTVLVTALVLIAACGDGGDGTGFTPAGTYSCRAAFPGAGGAPSMPAVCIEASGGTAQDLANNRQQCMAQGNMFALEPCPRAGALGGCRETAASTDGVLTTWYYDTGTATAADIESLCQGLASVAPAGLMVVFVRP